MNATATSAAPLIFPTLVLLAIGFAANAALHRFYSRGDGATASSLRSWVSRWDFSPESFGGFSYGRLALVSGVGLFVELLAIRWVSSEIRLFAYFKNFVLLACFLGFGLGCYLCRRRINLLALLLPLAVITLIVQLPWFAFRLLLNRLPMVLGVLSRVNFWSSTTVSWNLVTVAGITAAMIVVVLIFGLVAFTFIPLGQLVGWYLENATRGVLGYSVNIAGSLLGILLYTALCFVNSPPWVWLAAAGVQLTVYFAGARRLQILTATTLTLCAALASVNPVRGTSVYWSPYQKLSLSEEIRDGEVISHIVNTNGNWYQRILNLSPAFVSGHPALFGDTPVEWSAYNVPYQFAGEPGSVLVLGAGTGNDVAAALRHGAQRVVAVEIDPLILQLGRELHFERPYSSPRVTSVVDDARSYLQTADEQFDLIMFSLLDSHTTSSHFTNIRIDNYVYTAEALKQARRHLRPSGLMIVKFQLGWPWIAGRLHGLLQEAFGEPPLQFSVPESPYSTDGTFFVSGSSAQIADAIARPDVAEYLRAHPPFPMEPVELTTDDWPYFYQQNRGVPATVALISLTLAACCWFFLGQTGTTTRTIRWHFFFLGAAFFLLEAQIVSRMALLFGTTWAVNSIVIATLLLLIVAANVLVDCNVPIPTSAAYVGIAASIFIAYTIHLDAFFFRSVAVRSAVASLTLCLPVLFAGIVFIRSFAREGFRGEALGSNLLGAVVGGLLESMSYWTGLRSLLVIAAFLYLASWIALRAESPVRQLEPMRSV